MSTSLIPSLKNRPLFDCVQDTNVYMFQKRNVRPENIMQAQQYSRRPKNARPLCGRFMGDLELLWEFENGLQVAQKANWNSMSTSHQQSMAAQSQWSDLYDQWSIRWRKDHWKIAAQNETKIKMINSTPSTIILTKRRSFTPCLTFARSCYRDGTEVRISLF